MHIELSLLRTNEFAPVCEVEAPCTSEPELAKAPPPTIVYGPPQWARSSFPHGFPGSAFTGASRWDGCRALRTTRFIPKNGVPSAMAPCGSCMPHASVIAVPAPYVHSVKRVAPRSNLGQSSAVLWPLDASHSDSSPPPNPASELPASAPVLWRDWPRLPHSDSQPNYRASKAPLRSRHLAHQRPPRRSGPGQSARIGGFPGTSAWRAMLVRRMRPD